LSLKEALESLSFFSSLEENSFNALANIAKLNPYPKGYILHFENQTSTHLQFLVSGVAKVYKIDKHANEIFLYHLQKDSLLSEITTLHTQNFKTFSTLAFLEDSKVISLEYKTFKKEFLDTKLLSNEFTQEILKRSQKMQDLLNREFIFDAVSKVAMLLASDLNLFNNLKRHDVALMLHIQPATLSRVLNRLKRNNIIGIMQGKVEVLNIQLLKNIYEEEEI